MLAPRGLTLGHYPQSFEYVSLGGCAATRSAGQASTGYGAIEKMVLGLRLAAPAGEIALPPLPASAAGPSVRGLIVGSEGTLGVITELALRVRPAPAAHAYEGVFFEDFATGCEAFRVLARDHALPDVARLSDEEETRMSLALAGDGGIKGRLGRAYLGRAGLRGRLPGDPRLRGRPPRGPGAPAPRSAAPAPRRRARGRLLAGRGLAPRALRGPVPARRAARARA